MKTTILKHFQGPSKLFEKKLFIFGIIVGIVLLGVFLRFYNLRTNPEIYGDEGINMNVAWNLAQGKMQMFAHNYVFVPHPPLFYLILGGLLKLFGNDILIARALTAMYGIFTIIALYFIGKLVYSKLAGLLSSFFFAVSPLILVNNRWAFTYNQLMFFSVLTFLFTLKYVQTNKNKWIYSAGISAGFSMLTSFFGISELIYLIFVSFIFHRKKAMLAPLIALCLFGVYIVFMLLTAPEAFLFDLKHDFARSGALTLVGTFLSIFNRFLSFLGIGFWIPLSIVGFFLIDKERERNLLLLLFVLSLILILRTTSPSPYSFYVMSLMPYLMLGLAVFSIIATIHVWNMVFRSILGSIKWLRESSKYLLRKLGSRLDKLSIKIWEGSASVFMILIILFFIVGNSYIAFSGVISGFETPLSELTVPLSVESDRVVEFINRNMSEAEFAITSPHIGWRIKGNVSDILPALVVKGIKTPFFGSYPSDRFAFDCSYDKAKFVVIDDFWRKWGGRYSAVKKMMEEIEKWPVVLRAGEFIIHHNLSHMSENNKQNEL